MRIQKKVYVKKVDGIAFFLCFLVKKQLLYLCIMYKNE